jgi:hypothetical protein
VRAILDSREAGWRTALAARLQRGGWPDGLDAATGVELVIAVAKGVSLTPQRATDTSDGRGMGRPAAQWEPGP